MYFFTPAFAQCTAVAVVVSEPDPSTKSDVIPPVAKILAYVPSAFARPSLSKRLTVIVAFSPGAYDALSSATFTEPAVVEPTRTSTAVALMPVVAVADDFVPTVIFVFPAATPVSAMS